MHPEMYRVGMETMKNLLMKAEANGIGEIPEMVGKWENVYSAVSVMMNRETPYHRDHNSPGEAMDLMATFGEYSGTCMSILMLGKRFNYLPSTIMAFSRYLLWHGVNAVDGNRGCLAYYMHPAVMEWVRVRPPSFMRYEVLEAVGQSKNSCRVYSVF